MIGITQRFRIAAFALYLLALLTSEASAEEQNATPQGGKNLQSRARQADDAIETQWIWGPEDGHDNPHHPPLAFRKQFELASPIHLPKLRFVACFAHLRIRLDGKLVALTEAYDPVTEISLPQSLGAGRHELSVEAESVEGPSALFLELTDGQADSTHRIVSDSSWQVIPLDHDADRIPDDVTILGPLEPTFNIQRERRVGIDVTDDYEQWKQAIDAVPGNTASFFVSPGFELRQVTTADADEGSWVSMVFDPAGRLIIAREDAGLLRLTLSSDGTRVTHRETIETDLKECRGLTFLGDDLYVNANNSKGLYRLRRQDDAFDSPTLVHGSTGGVGHGRNDLTVGSDGKLYSIHGDSVDLPSEADDYTSPYRAARRGKKTSEGHLLRIDPESGKVEVLTAGLRNPFGIDFNQDGEAFTYDADAEYDMGAPWYRPTRVNHLVMGGDFGWRGVTKQWPPYYPDHPDNALPNLDVGKGSPTAVKFGTNSRFPAPYRSSLFVLDWAYGRVLAVHPIARGGSYMMTMETFLKGRPLNVTDLDFGPDGDMYVVTGGRKTQSALYRVSYVGEKISPVATSDWSQQRQRFSRSSRRLRRQLESMLTASVSAVEFDQAWVELANADPWIRHAASRVVEQVGTDDWKSRAHSEQDPRIAVAALLSLARSGQFQDGNALIRRLLSVLPLLELESERQQAYYGIWLTMQSMPATEESLSAAIAAALTPHYPSQSVRDPFAINRLLSEIQIRVDAANAIEKTINLMSSALSSEERLHYLFALRNGGESWDDSLRNRYVEGLKQAEYALGGAGLPEFLRRIEEEFLSNLDSMTRQRLEQVVASSNTVESDTALPRIATHPIVQEWTVEDLTSQVGSGDEKRGAEVFATSGCNQCHRFGTRGKPLGPDLTSVGRRFSPADLLKSILQPSDVIAENYRSIQIVTLDGRSIAGQPMRGGDYRSTKLHIATDPKRPSVTIPVEKSLIAEQKESDQSWMPTGLLDTFTAQEVNDLIAYLQSSP
ncbi:MAG: DUF7133 domain-containing protein [Rubripirellula sp.]